MPDTSTSGGAKLRSEINVTPLVDVVLVLLIIFMVVSPLLQRGFDLEVPREIEGPPPRVLEDQFVVTLTWDGACFINRQRASCGDLSATLRPMIAGGPRRLVFLSAARGLSYGGVVEAMDAIHLAGAGQIGLVTDDAAAERLGRAGDLR